MAGSALAADRLWTGGGIAGDWTDPVNWGGTLPGTGDNAVVNSTVDHPSVSNTAAPTSDVWIGNGGGNTGIVDLNTGGTITANNWSVVGRGGGTGTLNMSGGNFNSGGGSFIVGAGGGTTGTLVMTGGTIASSGQFWVSEGALLATATVTNGTITAGGEINIGRGGNASMTLNAGSSLSNSGGNFKVANGGTGSLTVKAGASVSSANGEFWVGQGNGSIGTLTQDGGAISVNNWVAIGREGGATGIGTYKLNAGTFTKTGGGEFIVGDRSTGVLEQAGGTLSVNNQFWVGQGGDSSSYSLSGGSASVNNWVAVGRNGGTGTFTMTGGAITKTGNGHFTIGSGGTGTASVSGGIMDVQSGNLYVGEAGNLASSLTLSALGEINVVKVILGATGTTTGNLNLNGGTLRTSLISSGVFSDGRETDPDNSATTVANVNFNGTQIVATADNAAFISKLDTAVIGPLNLKIDSNGKSIATAQVFTGTGGLVKSGSGSLELAANSTFEGAVVVEAGTLLLNGSLAQSSGATVAAIATLAGNATIAGNTVVSGDISPGNSVGTINLGNVDLQAGSEYNAELAGNGVNDLIAATGSFTANGFINILLSYVPLVGDSFDIANFASFSGTPTFNFVGPASLITWDTSQFGTNGVISITAVPEPSAALLGLVGSALLLRRRRR